MDGRCYIPYMIIAAGGLAVLLGLLSPFLPPTKRGEGCTEGCALILYGIGGILLGFLAYAFAVSQPECWR